MNIQMKSLKFEKLLIYKNKQLRTDWLEGIFLMEDFILSDGIYKNGPVFFSVEPEENEGKFGKFTYYSPINAGVELKEESTFEFIEELYVEEALFLRQAQRQQVQ